MSIITRSGKGSPLTISELDGNFTYLESISSGGVDNFNHYIFSVSDFVIEYGISTFEVGEVYQIPFVESGDDFSNIGHVDREPFIATGVTPSSFTNGSIVLHINPVLESKIYKRSNDLSFEKVFDIDNNMLVAINIENPTSSIITSLMIEGNASSNTTSKCVYYDDSINKLVIFGYNTNIELKVFNIEVTSATFSLI